MPSNRHTIYSDGRQQAACCSVQVAPVTPATCSYDLCRTSGFCTDDGTRGIADNKRDLALVKFESAEGLHTLEKRGQDHYTARLSNGIDFVIIAIIVSAIGRLFADSNANQVLRTQFILRPGTCIGPAIDLIPIGPGAHPPGLTRSQSEHTVEVSMTLSLCYNALHLLTMTGISHKPPKLSSRAQRADYLEGLLHRVITLRL